jgi:urease accessory protein
MKSKTRYFQILSLAAMLQPIAVQAHPFHWTSESIGFIDGLLHPLSASDHIITMLLVGFWISQANRSSTKIIALGFAALILIGGWLTLIPVEIAHAENLMNLSACLLGLMLVAGYKVSSVVAVLMAGNLAIFHGYVHAYDIWLDSHAFAYTAGFALATLALISVGISLRTFINRLAYKNVSHFFDGIES